MRAIITLTTDFGLQDPFVGVMKGVIANICPRANVIDLTHGVEAFNILDGALAIWQARRYFPAETVHVVVVDPGVGSQRRAILARLGEQWFVAPDNGVLTLVERDVLRSGGFTAFWAIENPAYQLSSQSHTFHGRDVFAPAGANLAAQIELGDLDADRFGRTLDALVQLPVPEPLHQPDGSIEGVILKCDKFGNLLTNIAAADLPAAHDGWQVEIGGKRITRFCRFYAEAGPGDLFAIAGSSGLLEIAMNQGSARETLNLPVGSPLRLTR